jgi:hypothetical protein
VAYFEDPDKALVEAVQKRLDNQDKINTEVAVASNELKAEVSKIKDNLSEVFRELQRH